MASPASPRAQGMQRPSSLANRHAGLRVDANDRRRKAMRQQRRNPADRARLALDIVEREIAFGRRIEFENLRNRKARLKGFPDIAAQAVAAGQPKPMSRLRIPMAAPSEDSGRARRYTGTACNPSARYRARSRLRKTCPRAPPRRPRSACCRARRCRRRCDRPAGNRTAGLRAKLGQPGKPAAPVQDAAVADAGGLRQAGGARGVDQQRAIVDGDAAPLGRRQRAAVQSDRAPRRCWLRCCGRRGSRFSARG